MNRWLLLAEKCLVNEYHLGLVVLCAVDSGIIDQRQFLLTLIIAPVQTID